MNTEKPVKRIAAVGDIHVRITDRGKWSEFFRNASRDADVLIICGDLTDTGHVEEAEILAEELKACTIPVVAVFGNHDHEADQQDEVRRILLKSNMYLLDGESVVIGGVGFAGTKGFCGGFDRFMLPMWGEQMNKQFVQETVNETLKLEKALAHLSREMKKIVILHYAPIKETIEGEPPEIYSFLGSSRLVEPIEQKNVTAVFHGHAHAGKLEARTPKGIPVFNVSIPILEKEGIANSYFIYEV